MAFTFKLRDVNTLKGYTSSELEVLRYNNWLIENAFSALGVITADTGTPTAPPGGVSSHHALLDLNTYDDHLQYLYMPGRLGGQAGTILTGTSIVFTLNTGVDGTGRVPSGISLIAPNIGNGGTNLTTLYSPTGIYSSGALWTFTLDAGLNTLSFKATGNNPNGYIGSLSLIAVNTFTGTLEAFTALTHTNRIIIGYNTTGIILGCGTDILSGGAGNRIGSIKALVFIGGRGNVGLADGTVVVRPHRAAQTEPLLIFQADQTGVTLASVTVTGVWTGGVSGPVSGSLNPSSLTIKDNVFTIQDDGDITRQLRFELSGITTGNIRTLTIPNASGTLVLLGLAQTWGALQTYRDDYFKLQAVGDLTKQAVFVLSSITTATTRLYTLPDNNGTFALIDIAQTWAGQQTYNTDTIQNGLLKIYGQINIYSGYSSAAFVADDGAGNQYTLQLPSSWSADTAVLPVGGGQLITNINSTTLSNKMVSCGIVTLTNQSADKATTNFSVSPVAQAAVLIVCVVIECTTADAVNAPIVKVTLGATDTVGAYTQDVITLFSMAATGRASYAWVTMHNASTNMTYAVTRTGGVAYGAARYNVRIKVM